MRRRRREPGTAFEIAIESLGFKGDGSVVVGGERLLVPGALPGERWQVRRSGRKGWLEPLRRLTESAERAAPVCPHFGLCGGCALQHLESEAYAALKLRQISGALRARGLAAPGPIPLHRSPLGSRRRLRLAYAGAGQADGALGFRRRHGRAVVAIDSCPVARPELVALLAPLWRLLGSLAVAGNGAEVTLSALDTGIEAVLHLEAEPGLADRQALAAFAEAADLVRLAVAVPGAEPEPVAARRPAVLTIAGEAVTLPPAAFLQATREGETCLQDFVRRQLAGSARMVDLFAGVGTLSLPLAAAGARIRAFESHPALVAACRHPRFLATRRDLMARPLAASELEPEEAVLLDPPRAGAEAQAVELARSGVPKIVYASCAPASFARDVAILEAGGYRLEALEAIDQFVFSAEVELIASLVRPRKGA